MSEGNRTAVKPPRFEPAQELRLAVVLYGGVSLAIYINGVVQELFNLVRATAPERPLGSKAPADRVLDLSEEELEGTVGVYRDLGRLLRWDEDPPDDFDDRDDPVVQTRFVIDILSGTSAGGINGIFLGKALANEQRVEELKRLWVDEGDILLLINDKYSVTDLRKLPLTRPPESVLNSRRFYTKALEAFCRMGEDLEGGSRYVDELDLWITATDLPGLPQPIKLFDRVVWESRHRNVFHFAYWSEYATGGGRNDFLRRNDPFLAYAARCTSSFPVAFEPMTLTDIGEVVQTFSEYRTSTSTPDEAPWSAFFPDYVREGQEYRDRPFADGGYLDNKPFTYSTQALARRRADVPVDRKLIYIEPDPSHPEREYVSERRPDALHNLQAVFSLPRAETIREDLDQLLARNRLIARRLLAARALELVPQDALIARRTSRTGLRQWLAKDLDDLVDDWGAAYGAYFRLKVQRVIDELADAITRATGFDDDSDEELAIRALVRAWVEDHYVERRAIDSRTLPTRNRFLFEFDLGFRMRRLTFVQNRIDELLRFDERAKTMTERVAAANLPGEGAARQRVRAKLLQVKSRLNEVQVELRRVGRALRARGWLLEGADPIDHSWLGQQELRFVLEGPTERGRRRGDPVAALDRAKALVAGVKAQTTLTAIHDRFQAQLDAAFKDAARLCDEALPRVPRGPAKVALRTLRHYYDRYESYDMTILPLAEEDAGEADVVEVIRIAPEDATSLIDETRSSRRKLGGVAVRHFGGFFDRAWRRNDIMWGRLDAAERLIGALLPDGHPQFQPLLERAQLAIIREELSADDAGDVVTLLVEGLLKRGSGTRSEKALKALVKRQTGTEVRPALQAALGAALQPPALLRFLKRTFTVDRRLDPRTSLRALGRGSRVLGQMLDAMPGNPAVKKPTAWMVRFGGVLWGLVELATPGTWWRRGFTYWFSVVLALALVLIVVGILFGVPGAQKTGWILVALSAAVVVAKGVVSDVIQRRMRARVILFGAALVLAVAFALLELRHIGSDAGDLWHWFRGLWTEPPKKK